MQEAVLTSADQLRKEGRKAGIQEGRQAGLLSAVASYFDARFSAEESWEKRLKKLSPSALQELAIDFPNIASVEQLEVWLRDHSGS